MQIYIFPNTEGQLEVIGSFASAPDVINELSKQFKVNDLIVEKIVHFEETRWMMEKKVQANLYTKIDENTFVKFPPGVVTSETVKFESNRASSRYDIAKTIISKTAAYIKTNSLEEAKKLCALGDYGIDVKITNIDKLTLDSISAFDDTKSSLEYLNFIDKLTEGTGKFSREALEQIKQINYLNTYQPSVEAINLFKDFEEGPFPVYFLFELIATTIYNRPYVAPLGLPILLILLPFALLSLLINFIFFWSCTNKLNEKFASGEIDKDRLIYYFLKECKQMDGACLSAIAAMAEHADTYDFVNSFLDRINNDFSGEFTQGYLPLGMLGYYIKERTDVINRTARNDLIKIILLGICPISLFYTLPKHLELLENQTFELYFLKELAQFIEGDRFGNQLNSPSQLYDIGQKLLNERKPELAVLFLIKVRADQLDYKDAMEECVHFFRANNDIEMANNYAKRANNTMLIDSLTRMKPISSEPAVSNGEWRGNPSSASAVTSQRIFAVRENQLDYIHTSDQINFGLIQERPMSK
ncbi:MAG: hypothetical protein H0U57_11250 [Tatlockia sp.]|nr:hypothetical protein [Tatlockia sp.]